MSAFDTKAQTNTSATNNSTVDPWAPQAAALTSAFGQAQNIANTAKTPTDFTAQFTPEQLSTFRTMINQGADTTAATNAARTGTALTGAGTSGVTGALSGLGSFNAADANNPDSIVAAANKYVAGQDIDSVVNNSMLNARQQARDVTLPGIDQNAAITGNTNSSRTGIADGLVERGLAEQATNLGGSLRSNAFADGLKLAQAQAAGNNQQNLGALTSAGSIGNAAANTGVNADTASIADNTAQGALASAGGAGLRDANQADLTNQSQQYASQYANLQQLMAIIGGQNWGSATNGTTTGQSTTVKSPSLMSNIGAGVGALASFIP